MSVLYLPTPKSQHYLDRYIKLVHLVMETPNTIGYTENHHILPRSMGGSNKSENLIRFTARQHFLAHWMLWKAYRNKQMNFAFKMMQYSSNKSQKTHRYWKLNSGTYEKLKKENVIFSFKKHSIETKKRMSKNHFDCSGVNNPMYGVSPWNKGNVSPREKHSKLGIPVKKFSCIKCKKEVAICTILRHINGTKCAQTYSYEM